MLNTQSFKMQVLFHLKTINTEEHFENNSDCWVYEQYWDDSIRSVTFPRSLISNERQSLTEIKVSTSNKIQTLVFSGGDCISV